jgi:RNA polymerase sigma-70 factor (ECF subfamily)
MAVGLQWIGVMTRAGRHDAFEAAVAGHYPGLVRRLTAVLGEPEAARDVAQEAYLRAYRSWDRFDGRDPRAWLHTIGLRLAFNERDRRRRWAGLLGGRADAASFVHRDDLDLHEALGHLRREHRAALLLSAVDGYTQSEIGEIMGVPSGTVASWLSRAKSQMRGALSDG